MLRKAVLTKQIYVTVNNEIGVLNKLADYVADRGINIEAVAGHEVQGTDKARIMMVVEDVRRASDALKEKGFTSIDVREELLVELDNRPGALKMVTGLLASREINIRQIYGTASPGDSPVRVILSTSDNQKALVALKKSIQK
ncbi:MAG TPA: ACT domain-containing protein [Syntrophales bacterium]|mgnify:CR=1 FL=1|jgi:hypothetical protein|nr:ACT domain-containing protein [Syntrophales bacterium]